MKDENIDILIQNIYLTNLKLIMDKLDLILKVDNQIYTNFQIISDEIKNAIQNLFVGDNSTISRNLKILAIQSNKLIKLPNMLQLPAMEVLNVYIEIIEEFLILYKNFEFNNSQNKVQFVINRFILESLIVSAVVGITKKNFSKFIKTRNEALNIVDKIINIYGRVLDYEERLIHENYFVETGENYNYMRDIVFSSIQFIIENSFSLPTRKIITLNRDRQIIELMYELYGDLSRIDEFIFDNRITYNELEIIRMGRQVAYYV